LEAKARRQGRFKDPSAPPAEPYVWGAIDPLTGRKQGPNIDNWPDVTRKLWGVPLGVTNAEYRAAMRKRMVEISLPPVGLPCWELTPEEYHKYCHFSGWDPKREEMDMPCPSWPLRKHLATIQGWYWEVKYMNHFSREEYHRRVLELAAHVVAEEPAASGLPPPAPLSSGG
jgi:hypothetical protein